MDTETEVETEAETEMRVEEKGWRDGGGVGFAKLKTEMEKENGWGGRMRVRVF